MAKKLNVSEAMVMNKISELLSKGILTRVGPFYNMDKSSGYVSLVAMEIPSDRYEDVVAIVNEYDEVAHNYMRENRFNMWFVIASTTKDQVLHILSEIEMKTGFKTYNFPKLKEFALDLFFEVV